MLAMQYSIQLPFSYDAALIRERVSQRKGLFDSHKGLFHKSFLYNEQEKLYAPFYLWKDVHEAQQFLLNDLFKGVVETFRRHRVRSWFSVHTGYGNKEIKPGYARREVDIIAPEEQLNIYLENEKTRQRKLLQHPDLYMHMVGLDADRWEILRFSLWRDKASALAPEGDSFHDYDVLHVSEP